MVRVRVVTSTPVNHSGVAALWLHLAATGVVLTMLMVLLADQPAVMPEPSIGTGADGGHGTGQVNGGAAAPDTGGRRDDTGPRNPVAWMPAADSVQVSAIAKVSPLRGADHPVNTPATPVVSHGGGQGGGQGAPVARRGGQHNGNAAQASGASAKQKPSKSPDAPPVRKGSSAKR